MIARKNMLQQHANIDMFMLCWNTNMDMSRLRQDTNMDMSRLHWNKAEYTCIVAGSGLVLRSVIAVGYDLGIPSIVQCLMIIPLVFIRPPTSPLKTKHCNYWFCGLFIWLFRVWFCTISKSTTKNFEISFMLQCI